MTYSASIVLNKVLTNILFIDSDPAHPAERILPFNVKYKLQRAKSQVEADVADFERQRGDLIREFKVTASTDPETNETVITAGNGTQDEFFKKLLEVANTQVEHEFLKLKPEDVEDINVEGITTEEISVFMIALIDDDKLKEEINKLKNSSEATEESTSPEETPTE